MQPRPPSMEQSFSKTMKTNLKARFGALLGCIALSSYGQTAAPGAPELNGVTPKADTVYINLPPDWHNNDKIESMGVAISNTGDVLVGWEDDGDGLTDLEGVWTLLNSSGAPITPETEIKSLATGETENSKLLSYFRKDGSALPPNTSWGPKIKANLFGSGIGMGATSFTGDPGTAGFNNEIAEYSNFGDGGDYPTVQLLTNDGKPIGIVAGVTSAYANGSGNIRIGDWDYLSNSNLVIVGESRQNDDLVSLYGGAAGATHAIYRIVAPSGTEVKAVGMVSEVPEKAEIWHGVGVTKNGFAVRFALNGAGTIRLFNNDGTPASTNIDLATLATNAIVGAGGRGDGIGFHGNGNDAYVLATAGNDAQGQNQAWVTVINTNGTIRYTKAVSDDIPPTKVGRIDAAIDSSGRVFVVYDDSGVVLGRAFDSAGKPLGGTFYVSEKELPGTAGSGSPRVAFRGDLAAVVWQSSSSDAGVKVAAARTFSLFKAGTIESVGLTRLVPDTVFGNPVADALGNWEPYASVLGTTDFLVEGNTFADGSTENQRYVVMIQPAAGGAGKLGEAFFADNGTAFKGQINYSRQNGNPGRVAGDTRPGAVNFIAAGEASPHVIPEFQSDNRWNLGFDRLSDGRYGVVQTFKLDPATLAQTPLSKAQDSANGRLTTGGAAGNQITRFGGDVAALDNGNFVSVVEDRSGVRVASGNAAVATIFAPDGSVVKDSFLVATGDIWSNVAAYQGGFAVRASGVIYFFDNAGNPKGQVDQNTSGEAYDRGRGDGTRIASHINTPFVFLAGKVAGANLVKVSAFDSRNQSFVATAVVSEPAFSGDFDRVNLAVDALNRLVVSWVSQPAGYEAQQVAARVLAFNPTSKAFTPLTASFLPFINAAKTGGIRTLQMSPAITTKQILISAKGEINLQNKPDQGANSPREVNFYTVFTHPDPKEDPTTPVGGTSGAPTMTITRNAGVTTITWTAAAGFTLQSAPALGGTWTDVATTGNSYTVTGNAKSAEFFRLRKP